MDHPLPSRLIFLLFYIMALLNTSFGLPSGWPPLLEQQKGGQKEPTLRGEVTKPYILMGPNVKQ